MSTPFRIGVTPYLINPAAYLIVFTMIHLSYSVTPDRKALIIFADEAAVNDLEKLYVEIGWRDFVAESTMFDVFEKLISNSELDWIRPEECGDLTDAPILGIRDRDDETVVERWGYMDYQVKSPLNDLLNRGKARFTAP